jgi:hypothetical protein
MSMNNDLPLSKNARAIIFGSLLGDGSLRISKHYKNARFSFRHSAKQEPYFLWKVEQLQGIASEKCVWQQIDKVAWGKDKLRFQSHASNRLTEIYNLTHKNGKKQIRRKWLNLLMPISLAIWWLDDGSLVSDSRQGVFCTDSFSLKEVYLLKRYLKVVWDIETSVGKVKDRPHYRLWIRSTDHLQKFLKIILPFIKVKEMLPKVILLYKDRDLQQRWISEIANLSHFPIGIVISEMEKKKTKWREFRE